MKKNLLPILLALALCLSACTAPVNDSTEASTSATETADTMTDTTTIQTDATSGTGATNAAPIPVSELPLPEETTSFAFSSGAGAWYSHIKLNRDGTFTGHYSDSEMDIGEGYPNGSAYICDFSGRFANFEKVNDYTYKMTLADLQSQRPEGQEWIENGIRFISSVPLGLVDTLNDRECKEFILYLPDAPVAQLHAEFLSWSPYRSEYNTNPNATLSCYGIWNVTTNGGFFDGFFSDRFEQKA